ncbi:DNA-binding transcriptional regulator, LysR family [Octadecabacter temperatus]|uniref:DNA-binding transcriptional activator GcvA n=1 Tax=Octadecabacter temperatus TaxID=1458307 RepID=A0A0K0Y7U4_9RHOB|nr:LysR family transcriptional regulator [Octadecabacter temperatus]AKS46956.1 DNA-binding transcriptional activator GcvA [Octadecabacter temperatus]SIO24253.1 DNA-binding transcriptional regulator, LysR family [Octadecabacter temperatus]
MIKDWNNLRYLLALYEGGTMKRAAELLDTSSSTVSRHVRSLSEDCQEMLAKQTKGEAWTITPKGLKLVKMATDLSFNFSNLDTSDQEEQVTRVAITSLDFVLTYYLAPNLPQLLNEVPNIEVSLLSSDRRLSLAFNEADIALRFGRPCEGQLVAKRICSMPMRVWKPKGRDATDWVGMSEDLDWTPDMEMGRAVFGRDPIVRTSSYAAAKRTACSLGLGTIGPDVIMGAGETFAADPSQTVEREVWSVIHESRRMDKTLDKVKEWLDHVFDTVVD